MCGAAWCLGRGGKVQKLGAKHTRGSNNTMVKSASERRANERTWRETVRCGGHCNELQFSGWKRLGLGRHTKLEISLKKDTIATSAKAFYCFIIIHYQSLLSSLSSLPHSSHHLHRYQISLTPKCQDSRQNCVTI